MRTTRRDESPVGDLNVCPTCGQHVQIEPRHDHGKWREPRNLGRRFLLDASAPDRLDGWCQHSREIGGAWSVGARYEPLFVPVQSSCHVVVTDRATYEQRFVLVVEEGSVEGGGTKKVWSRSGTVDTARIAVPTFVFFHPCHRCVALRAGRNRLRGFRLAGRCDDGEQDIADHPE